MVWEKLNTEMIKLNLEAENTDQIFEKLGGEFVERGYCKESYVQALKDREAEFPTGITMASGGVAIPHTDASHVLKKGIAFATLKEPVQFVEMGTDDEYVNARIVCMLAVDEKGHLDLLQAIIGILQSKETVDRIMNAGSPEEVINIIKEEEQK